MDSYEHPYPTLIWFVSFHSFHLKFPMSFLRKAWDHIHGQGAQANAALNLNMRLMTTARVTRSWLLWTCQTLQGHRDCWVHHCHQPTQEIPLSSQVVIILSIRFPQLVFQQEKSYNMRSVWSQPCLQNTHLWYSNSGTLTTLGGVGRIRSMGTSWTKPTNGQSCWYSTNVQKFLARQCWKQCWLNSMAALWLNWRKSFVMYAIYIYMLCIFFLLHVFFLHYSASPWSAHHFPQVGLDAKTSGLAATVWWCHRSCNPQISTGAAPILYIGLSSTHQRPRQHGLDHVQSDWILGSKVKKISSVLFTLAVETGSNSEKCARMHDSSVMPPDNQSPYAYVKAWNTTHYESTPFPTSETLGICI